VEAAGDLVTTATELATGVQHGEHNLCYRRRGPFIFGSGCLSTNAAAVIDDAPAAVSQQVDLDAGGVTTIASSARCRPPGRRGGGSGAVEADVHARAFAHCLEAFEDR